MELLGKVEHIVAGWLKNIPHLPKNVRAWIGENVWWMAAILAVLMGFGALGLLITFFANLSTLGSPYASYYATATFAAWETIKTAVALVFTVLGGILIAMAVTPLREKQKKGWVLLFASLLLGVVATIVGAILTLNPFTLIADVIFGALWTAIAGYFLFEIHGEFMHTERSKGAKKPKA